MGFLVPEFAGMQRLHEKSQVFRLQQPVSSAVFLSPRFFLLCLLLVLHPAGAFLPKGKMRKSVRTAERTNGSSERNLSFVVLRARNATRLLDKRPNSLSSHPPGRRTMHSLSLDRNPLKCCAARPRGQPILIKVVGLRRSLPRPKLPPPPHPLKKSPARPSTPPDALSLAKRASHTLDVRPRAGGRAVASLLNGL